MLVQHKYKSVSKPKVNMRCGISARAHTHTHTRGIQKAMWSVCERGGVARSTRLCADSGNRVETAAAVWQWRRKEWSNAKKIPPERL